MKHILMVVGSLRKKSFNRQLCAAIVADLEGRAEVRELSYADLPWMNQDAEFPAPAAVQRVRDELAWADGIWFVCPEYNGFFPGHIKNLVDWLSRPVVAGDYNTVAIAGKAVTVSGCAGRSGSRTMQAQLTKLLGSVRARVLEEPTVGVVIPGESWASDELVLSESDHAAIAEQINSFINFMD
ncbi:MAG: NADPH-dependent FMN reductase [Coriobacteriales bacterium]|nr:NADPH-dependent FMN reductase [Coriobacteriales bacterium]